MYIHFDISRIFNRFSFGGITHSRETAFKICLIGIEDEICKESDHVTKSVDANGCVNGVNIAKSLRGTSERTFIHAVNASEGGPTLTSVNVLRPDVIVSEDVTCQIPEELCIYD